MHRRSFLYSVLLLSAACGSGTSAPGGPPAPTPAPGAPPTPTGPSAHAPTLRLAPGTTRYLVRQDVHIQQDFAGLPPTIDLKYSLFVTAAVSGPADSVGLPTSFTVDSVTVDSGSQLPPQINIGAARGFRVSGRLIPTGEFVSGPCDTSSAAASLGNLLPRFRTFFPRLPAGGVAPQTSWTDSTNASDAASCSGGAAITTRAENHRSATTWEDHGGVRALRLETTATYAFNGSGQQGGAPFTLEGSGLGIGVQFVTGDGRYLGGELRDSSTLTIDLPVQGVSIPRRQLAHTTITVLPR
jgi:hypothetical protein